MHFRLQEFGIPDKYNQMKMDKCVNKTILLNIQKKLGNKLKARILPYMICNTCF